MSSSLKLGFIGGALQSAVGTTHVIASRMDRRWDIAAACFSTDQTQNLQTAKKWELGEDHLYADWLQMLDAEHERLDAVVVLTPTPLHKEMVIELAARRIPVICEKALCTSLSEGLEIKRAVEESNTFLAVTYNYTGYPMVREMKARIDRGDLGNLVQIRVEMPQEGYLKHGIGQEVPVPQDWRLRDLTIPTLYLDLGVHVDNIVSYLTGEVAEEVVAVNNTFGQFPEVVDNTMSLAKYSNGIDCSIWFGKSALGHSNGLKVEVYGTQGALEWVQLEPERLTFSDFCGTTHLIDPRTADLLVVSQERYNRFKPGHPAGFLEAFANYYYDLADDLLRFRNGEGSGGYTFGVDHAVTGMATLEAMHKSAESKVWQPVNQRH